MATDEIKRDQFYLTGEAGYAGMIGCSYCLWESTPGELQRVLEQVRKHQETCRGDG